MKYFVTSSDQNYTAFLTGFTSLKYNYNFGSELPLNYFIPCAKNFKISEFLPKLLLCKYNFRVYKFKGSCFIASDN